MCTVMMRLSRRSRILLILTAIVVAVTIMVTPTRVLAGEGTFFKYGVGIPKDNDKLGSVKNFSFGYQGETSLFFDYKYEAGLWADSNGDGRSSSGYGAASLGLEPRLGTFYVHSFWGLAYITNTDTQLSTNIEFMQDFGLGLRDSRGVGIGLGYKHVSNAGIKLPNRGRDFLCIQMQIPW